MIDIRVFPNVCKEDGGSFMRVLTFDGREFRIIASEMFIPGTSGTRCNLKTFQPMACRTELSCFYTEFIEYRHFTK